MGATVGPRVLARLMRNGKGLRGGEKADIKAVDWPASTAGFQSDLAASTLSGNGVITCVNLLQEGNSFNQRIGRRIMLKSLYLTGQIVHNTNASASNTPDYILLSVIFDRQPNGATPPIYGTGGIYMDGNYQNSTQVSSSLAGVNLNFSERFHVLASIPVVVPSGSNAACSSAVSAIIDQQANETNVARYIPMSDLETHYNSQTPINITGISSGAIWVVTQGLQNTTLANYYFNWKIRIRYSDMFQG